jgi:hypothetical protein
MKYRKKPVVIEAVQWWKMGDHPEVSDYMDCFSSSRFVACPECGRDLGEHGQVSELESTPGVAHRVCPGDWIITGIKGENYACKPDVFKLTYEKATDGTDNS